DVRQDRINRVSPTLPIEHPIVADTSLHVMTFHVGPQAAVQPLGGERLTDRADIVSLAFDGEQRGASDCPRVDTPALPLEFAQWPRVLLKHCAHRLQVEFSR